MKIIQALLVALLLAPLGSADADGSSTQSSSADSTDTQSSAAADRDVRPAEPSESPPEDGESASEPAGEEEPADGGANESEPGTTDEQPQCRPYEIVHGDPSLVLYPVLGKVRLDPESCLNEIVDTTKDS